jgi:copper chaperone NosL
MRASAESRSGSRRPVAKWLLGALALAPLLAACDPGPVPIAYDRDGCDYCRMQITDPRYGGELITRTGKVHKFDSIECLASFYSTLQDAERVRSLLVSDYRDPGTLIDARQALYIHHGGPGSPLGRGLLALRRGSDATPAAAPAGDTLSWNALVELVSRDGLAPGLPGVTGARGSGSRDAHSH